MGPIDLSPPPACPVCKGTGFTQAQSGFLVKKIRFCCTNCHSGLELAGKGQEYRVVDLGPEYSNCAGLFHGLLFTPQDLTSDGLPVYSDQTLAQLAKGEIPDSFYPDEEPSISPSIEGLAGRLVLRLDNLYTFEDRVLRSPKSATRSFQTLTGQWGEVGCLPEPRYQNVVETLDSGSLWITSLCYRFSGEQHTIEEPLDKVKAVLLYQDGMGISRTNSLKIEYYKGGFHWPLVSALMRGSVRNASRKG